MIGHTMAALWQDDRETEECVKCHAIFSYTVHRHHCRKCGLIHCDKCSSAKMIIPKDQLTKRPYSWLQKQGLFSDEDEFRGPLRVCYECANVLRPLQAELRLEVSRCHMETKIDADAYDEQYLPNMPFIDFQMENQISNACLMIHTSMKSGEQKVPSTILAMAKGVAFITILKVGFMVTGRYGTGIVLSRLPDGGWSAPSAIAMTGLGWGIQVGTEVCDVMLILTSDSAVEAFKSTGQLTIGAELGVSIGPVGKSLETDVTLGNKGAAHAFSYATSHGLYAGVSLEACGIAQCKGVNRAFYGERAHASALLAGDYGKPYGAEPLYKALDMLAYDGDPPAELEANRHIHYEKSKGNHTGSPAQRQASTSDSRAPAVGAAMVSPGAGGAATVTTSVGGQQVGARVDYETLGQAARFATDSPAVVGAALASASTVSSSGSSSSSSSGSKTR